MRDALAHVSDIETVYVTILALYILEEAFGDFEDQWQMIASKARKWLETAGVKKPSTLARKFKFRVLQ